MIKSQFTAEIMKDLMNLPEGIPKADHFRAIAKKHHLKYDSVSAKYYSTIKLQGERKTRANKSEEAKVAANKLLDSIIEKSIPTKAIKMNGSVFEFPENSFMVGGMKITW